jgi:HEAT repeat protein
MQVVPGLFHALDSPDARVRETAVMALGPIKHADVPNALLWALGDDEAAVREAAADALGRLGKETLETLIGALGHEQPSVRAAVALALAKIAKGYGRADQATPALIERLGDYDATVRRIAAEALGQIEDPDATAALVERLWDDHAEVRRMAAWALGQTEDPDGMEGLIHALGDPDESVREAAAGALGKLDEPPKLFEGGAVAALLDVLAGPWGEAPRRAAAQALAQIGVRHAETGIASLPGLCAALADPDAGLRRLAARALGEAGGKLDESVPKGEAVAALAGALRDPDAEVRQNAASALGALGDAGAVGGLVAVLRGAR